MSLRLGCALASAALVIPLLCGTRMTCAQTPAVPDWALPGSATHKQVPPPVNFHRPARSTGKPLGMFEGQADVGAAVVPGSSTFDPLTGVYTITSAGYNIWYTRDEFRFAWKRLSGDVSLAADATFPNADGYGDRKAVLHLAERPERGAAMQDLQYRFGGVLDGVHAKRIGLEKHGDSVAIFVSLTGEPMHQLGPPVTMHFAGPFYVGLGFCSHLPDKADTAAFSDVRLENAAGSMH